MSNPIWDWWFGGIPQSYMTVNRSRNRFAMRRRFLVFLAAIGATHGVGIALVWADEGEVQVAPVPVDWLPSSSLATMLAMQGPTAPVPGADSNESASPDDTPSEDASRKERLRQLLDDDDDAPLSLLDSATELKNVAPQDDATSPSANKVDPSVKDNESVLAKPFIQPRYPEVEQGRFVLPPIRAVSTDQKPIGNGRIPETVRAGDELKMIALPEDGTERVAYSGEGVWPELIRPWAAPNTFSHPLYFEDRMLERHGHERWGCFQPLASGTRFFATLPMLPYLSTVQSPCEIVYTKGYYRAGSPTPKFIQRPPLERRAVIVEAAAISGAIIALP